MPGTLVHHIEKYPSGGGIICTKAGTHSVITRRIGSKVIIKLPSAGQEVALDENCYATVGKVSNTNHYTINLMCPQRLRWLGFRPLSGLKKKKDGYCGRKIHPPKPMKIYDTRLEEVKYEVSQPIHILADYD